MTIRYATTADGELPKPEDWIVYDEIDTLISEDRLGLPLREAVAKVISKKDATK